MGLFSKKRGAVPPFGAPQLPEHLELVRELGRGSNGVVYLARNRAAKGQPEVAVKLVEVSAQTKERKHVAVVREVYIHGSARNAHIVPVSETFQTESHVGIVMEYIGGGDLLEYINSRGPLPENEARWIFQQLMYAVRYLHQKMRSMHRDIKLDNILVKDSTKVFPMVYLCDFSFAKTRGARHGDTVSVVGSTDYFAPEILLRKEKTRYDGMTADIFSCGVCLYVILYGQYPKSYLHKKVEDDVYEFDLNGIGIQIPQQRQIGRSLHLSDVSPELLHFLSSLVKSDPKKRITMDEVWRDPWFRKDLPDGAEKGAGDTETVKGA